MRDYNSVGQRLAHGWRLAGRPEAAAEVIREFIRPAVRAVPGAIAARLKPCSVLLPARLDGPDVVSRWVETEAALEITAASEGIDAHDLALELLVCVGQALWATTSAAERAAWLRLLRAEIDARVAGEIDEEALAEKRRLLSSPAAASSRRRLEAYARTAFAGTVAEYIHCLWHDVTVREGPRHLPARWLRERLQMLARWFPPGRGYRLWAG